VVRVTVVVVQEVRVVKTAVAVDMVMCGLFMTGDKEVKEDIQFSIKMVEQIMFLDILEHIL
jgi:hypothetical protein